jgi:hypothetical protein
VNSTKMHCTTQEFSLCDERKRKRADEELGALGGSFVKGLSVLVLVVSVFILVFVVLLDLLFLQAFLLRQSSNLNLNFSHGGTLSYGEGGL